MATPMNLQYLCHGLGEIGAQSVHDSLLQHDEIHLEGFQQRRFEVPQRLGFLLQLHFPALLRQLLR